MMVLPMLIHVQIDWHGNTPKSNSEIETERARLQAIEDAK